jgi:streptogramin lyase
VAIDSGGNLYIADSDNQRIRKVTTDGVITTVAGNGANGFGGDGGLATEAQLNQPLSVAVDSAGNLYIADSGNQRIRKITTAGVIRTVAGIGTAGYSGDGGPATEAQLAEPYGMAIDSTGNLYIADSGNQRIRSISAGWLSDYVIPTLNSAPASITTGPDGALWFTEQNVQKVGRIDPTTYAITEYSLSELTGTPGYITSGSDGALWFPEPTVGKLGRMDPTTHAITEYAVPTISKTIAGGPEGAFWFAGSYKIYRFDLTTHAITEYAIDRNPCGSIACGPDGNIWFSVPGDFNTATIYRFDPVMQDITSGYGTASGSPCNIESSHDGSLLLAYKRDSMFYQLNVIIRIDPLTRGTSSFNLY